MQTETPLKVILTAEGRKQSWLAGLAGIAPTMLSYMVSGRVNPTPDEQARIAVALGRPVADLFPGSVPDERKTQRERKAA